MTNDLQADRMPRERRGVAWLENTFKDLRFGSRLWRKQPGSFFSAVTALTLGLGLVAFSLSAINCVFFGRLPFPDADRLVYTTIPEPAFREFQEQQTSFEGLSAFASGDANFKATGAPSRRRVCFIGANFLVLTRMAPLLGRGFLPGEDKAGAAPVALIGYDLWQQEFGGSPAAAGATILLDGQPRTVVGIMPEGFKFPINDQIWIPTEPGTPGMAGWGFVFGRLKTGVSFATGAAELNLVAARLAGIAKNADSRMKPSIRIGAFTRFEEMKGANGPGPGMVAMLVITLLVLFIACANVAGLNLANAARRETELAVRGALGATRTRLISQMLVESLILSASGAVCGLLILGFLVKLVPSWLAASQVDLSQVPFWARIRIDGRLLTSLIGLIALTNLMAGLWPALQATKREFSEPLKAGGSAVTGARTGKFPWLLAAGQIAFSVVVLAQSFVLLNYSRRLRQSHLPFDPASVWTARVTLPPSAASRSFFEQLERGVGTLPGVRAAALSSSDPASGQGWKSFAIEGASYPRPEDYPNAGMGVVSAGFFRALNVAIIEGRGFDERDTLGSPPAAIVNSTFAKMFLPPGNPTGLRFREGTNAWLTIVGLVPDLEYDPSADSRQPAWLVPASQQPVQSMVVMVRGDGTSEDFTKLLRAEVARLHPDVAIYHTATMQSLINHQIIGYYLASALLGVCGTCSVFLATLGIFGLITLSVNQRTRETGVRLALGATRGRIAAMFLKRAGWQIGAGLVFGAGLAFALDQMLRHSIAGYPTVDHPAMMLAAAAGFLGVVSLMAVLIPAVRGARVDPLTALRYE